MKQPPEVPNSNLPTTTVLKPRNCAHWANQLQRLFPKTETPVTAEFVDAMGKIMAMYQEHIIAAVCNPTYGICTRFKYLPSLMELKEELEKLAQRDAEREKILKRRKDQLEDSLRIPSMRSNAGRNGTMTEADKAKAMAQLESVGISKEVFDAIPDQKDYDWKKPALNIPELSAKPELETKADLQENLANPFD